MLREDQIVRYGRQILLREVGGRGQERLLASGVRVLGEGPAIDDAVAWLLAGGTPVRLAGPSPGGFLTGVELEALNPDAAPALEPAIDLLPRGLVSTAKTQVVLGAGVAWRTPAACDQCWELALGQLEAELAGGPVGSLAALTLQRLVLGWSDPLGLILWRGDRFEGAPLPSCTHTPNPR